MERAQLFYIPSKNYNCGYYAVAEEAEEALEVFKECWEEVADSVDRKRNITLKDLVVVEEEIMIPNCSRKVNRILNTDAGLIDIEIIKYFDKPAFFGKAYGVGPNEIPEIVLSAEAWSVYNGIDYDGRGLIVFQADDIASGVKVRVNGGSDRVVWMYTYETDTIYNEVYKDSEEEAIEFAISILRDAKALREKYRGIYDEEEMTKESHETPQG